MRRRTLALYAAAPLILSQCTQCEPACVPVGEQPAAVTTVVTEPPPTTAAATTTPVIPLGVSVEPECSMSAPAIHVTNLSDQDIVFTWTGQVVIKAGEEYRTAWPMFQGDQGVYLDEVQWDARSLSDVVFDSGVLMLTDVAGTQECEGSFFAEIVAASQNCRGDVGIMFNASAPTGYDSVHFEVKYGTSVGQSTNFEQSLPMSSDRNFFWQNAGTIAGQNYTLTGNGPGPVVVFVDDDGSLPMHTIALDPVTIRPAIGCGPAVSPVTWDPGCDNLVQPNTQPILLWLELFRPAPAAGWTITANGTTDTWENRVFEDTDSPRLGWPRTGSSFQDPFISSYPVTVRDGSGNVVFSHTFTSADVTNTCAPAFTGGRPT
jgi:hypothetical protein